MRSSDAGRSPLEWTEKDFARESEIINRHVASIEARISDHVRQSLIAEAAPSNASEKWIDAAFHTLLAELPDEEVEARSKSLLLARAKAKESLRSALDKRLALPQPDDEEVHTHSRELAQVIVSNWLALVNRASRRARREGKELALESNWLPAENSFADVSRGLDAFAADSEFVVSELRGYLESKTHAASGFEINASLMVQRDNGRIVVRPATIEPPKPEPRPKKVGDEIFTLACRRMLGVILEPDATSLSLDTRKRVEAIVDAGRFVAANTSESHQTFSQRKWLTGPDVQNAVATFVLSKPELYFRSYAQRGLESATAASKAVFLESEEDLSRELHKITSLTIGKPTALVSDEERRSISDAVCIAYVATAFKTAIDQGVIDGVRPFAAKRQFEQHSGLLFGKSQAPSVDVVECAEAFTRCAASMPIGDTLRLKLARQIGQSSHLM